MRPLEVVVRGHARRRYHAERATVTLAANIEGTDRENVYRRAVGLQDPLTQDLSRLQEAGAVLRWSSNQLRVFSYRPHSDSGIRPQMYRVAIKVEAEFGDFEQLSAFLDRWALQDGVEVGATKWDVTEDNRRAYEAELRSQAVADQVREDLMALEDGQQLRISLTALTPKELAALPEDDPWWSDVVRDGRVLKGAAPDQARRRFAKATA